MDAFYQQPPITRTLTAATLIWSCIVYTNNSMMYQSYFVPQLAFFKVPPQIWRVVLSFLVTGPKFGIILDPYFLFTYGKQLETGSTRFKGRADFVWYIIFNMIVIELIAGFFLGMPFFNEGLLMALVHTFAQDNPHAKATVFVIQIDAKFLPVVMVFMNFVTRGPASAYVGIAGIAASHAFDFLTRIWPTFGGGRNWLETPHLLKQCCRDDLGGVRHKAYGTAYTPGSSNATAGSSSATSWNQRGVGRRLGD